MSALKFKKILLIFIAIFSVKILTDNNWNIFSLIHSFNKPKFDEIKDTQQLKNTFFEYLLPLIKKENEKIRHTRLLIKNNQFSDAEIMKLAKKYRIKQASKTALLNAIDVIPVSLVLAQAAVESNWGRSRFAKKME